MLLDSNVIIYSAQPDHAELRRFIAENVPAVSAVSIVEVIGYHRLAEGDRHYFEEFFAVAEVLPITPVILDQAVRLRQARKMGLGDAIVAATALVHRRTLVTRNTKDFDHIAGLALHDPFSAG
ncbi:MAG TPA: type II toxin-antitoxin system VapC family toxin [Fimbriiglobus sp.]|nr:type II toxin-antitoxin system VapC family toxin [Fimbriiglobus sp.]